MKGSRVSKRYASALFQAVLETNRLEVVETDLSFLQKEYDVVDEFRNIIESPVVATEVKQRIFSKIFKDRLQDITYNFVSLLIQKNRESILIDIITEFFELLDEHRGILRGNVYSVVPLSDSQLMVLKTQLDNMTKKNVIITQHIDHKLLGGFVVKIQDMVYDTSLHHQLNKIRQILIES